MTPEEQRIAIAEACGWKDINLREFLSCGRERPIGSHPNNPGCLTLLPDYLNDLNVMHEAEKVLTEEQWEKYTVELGWIIYRTGMHKSFAHATASQRAEAFLKTI